MIARDWQIAIALTPIVIIALEPVSSIAVPSVFWLRGRVDDVEFTAQLPHDGSAILLLASPAVRGAPGAPASWQTITGSTGGAPLMSLNLLIAAVRRRAGVAA